MESGQTNQSPESTTTSELVLNIKPSPTEVIDDSISTPSQPTQEMSDVPPNSKTKRSKKLLFTGLALLIVAVAIGTAYYYFPKQKQESESFGPMPTAIQESLSPAPEAFADWKTHTASFYKVKYPGDLIVKEEDGVLNLSKWGPTQTAGTELFDGFSVSLKSYETSQTPEDYAEELIVESEIHGMSGVANDPEYFTVNDYEGVTYTEEGLGTFKHYVLGADNDSVLVHISVIVADPGYLGFQETVDQILSTFEFSK